MQQNCCLHTISLTNGGKSPNSSTDDLLRREKQVHKFDELDLFSRLPHNKYSKGGTLSDESLNGI